MAKKQDKQLLIFGVLAGGIASLCCIGPVLLVLFGLSGISFALSFGRFTWLFLSLGILFFVGAVLWWLRSKKCCSVKGLQRHWIYILLAFLLMAGLLYFLKYVAAPYLAQFAYR